MDVNEKIRVGILTISDRCSQGVAQDLSGPALRSIVEEKGWVVAAVGIVPDEKTKIIEQLLAWSDRQKLNVILTTGGTGLGPRDVTTEATRVVLEKELPGFSELMRLKGLDHTPLAPLSRSLTGVRGETIILNFPGSPAGAVQSLQAVEYLIPHALRMIYGKGH